MRAPPIFRAGAATPEAPLVAGLVVTPPTWRTDGSAWIHGALAADHDGEPPQAWMHALFVTAVTERGCVAQTCNVARDRKWFAPPRWLASGFGLYYLPFHLELHATLTYPLQNEPTWVTIAARDYVATPFRLEPGAWGQPNPDSTGVDALMGAYAQMAVGAVAAASEWFAVALESTELRADLDANHLLDGARAAAQALSDGDAQQRAANTERGLAWIGETVRRRADRLAEVARQLVVCDAEQAQRLHAEQDVHASHLAAVRDDPLLAPLRACPEYLAAVSPVATKG